MPWSQVYAPPTAPGSLHCGVTLAILVLRGCIAALHVQACVAAIQGLVIALQSASCRKQHPSARSCSPSHPPCPTREPRPARMVHTKFNLKNDVGLFNLLKRHR
jgi:hypothetical protein